MAISVITSSLFLPPPDPVFGYKLKIVPNKVIVSF